MLDLASARNSPGRPKIAVDQHQIRKERVISKDVLVRCDSCNIYLPSGAEFKSHLGSIQHSLSTLLEAYRKHRETTSADKGGVTVSNVQNSSSKDLTIETKPCREKKTSAFTLLAKVTDHPSPVLKRVALLTLAQCQQDTITIAQEYKNIPLSSTRVFVELLFKCSQVGSYTIPIVFILENHKREVFSIIRQVTLRVSTSEVKELEAKEKFQRRPRVSKWNVTDPVPGYGPPPSGSSLLVSRYPLSQFHIPYPLYRIVNHGLEPFRGMGSDDKKLLEEVKALLAVGLKNSRYQTFWHLLLWLEEHQLEVDILKYDMHGETITPVSRSRLMSLRVPGLAEKRPSVLRGDRIVVRRSPPPGCEEDAEHYPQFEGIVHFVREHHVELGFGAPFFSEYSQKTKWDVHFFLNRHSLRHIHSALDKYEDFRILFPPPSLPWGNPHSITFNPREEIMETNPEQLQAVQAILNHTSLPYPFILFGPPGTGKTFTLVEAVTQLVLLDTEDVHVLICGPSNSSCDVIAKRLIERIPKEMVRGSVHRLYASSRQRREVDDELIPFSNMDDDGQVSFESRESLMDYQVIICTLITAGRLAQAVFPEGHFTHLIIDEVSQATEPDAVVALNAVRKRKGYREPHVILAGDPRQLGPVVFSPLAETNLGTSLLERLMARPPYVRDVDQPEHYNPSYIVKLKKNFRSHPALLETPNKLFYDSELEACADRREVDAFIGHPILKNPKIPLVFHGVQGRDQKEGRSPSYFNPEEATLLVTKYVDQILQSKSPKVKPHEIGIITPYRGQVYKISKLLEKHGISGITVGTPEEFQGQERKVIMMSTVRSTQEFLQVDRRFNLGFLRNPKRFNVAITRARALMIVVGCPQILATDPNWHALVSFAYTRGCYEGCELPPEVLEATAPNAPSEPRGLDELLKILREMNLNPTVAENLASERPLMASREE